MLSRKSPRIPLPKGWTKHVRSAVLHVISLAQYAAVYSRSWAVDSMNGRLRLRAELDRAHQEIVQGSGTNYSPAVVEAFQAIWDEIKKLL